MIRANRIRFEARSVTLRLLSIIFLTAFIGGCKPAENKYIPAPPPEVTVDRPVQQPITEYLELTGNTQAFETVDLRARVPGFLTGVNFKDGEVVKKDELLFVIEREPYEIQVKLAEANIASAQANLNRSTLEYNRQLQLVKQSATSQSTVEQWQATRDADQASLGQARANAETAKLNLSYTHVKAPFKGRVDRHLVDRGNLVGSGQATLLATISRLDPIYAYFNVNERDLVRVLEKRRQEGLKSYNEEPVPIYMGIEGEEGYPHEGRFDFAATSLDPATGTLLMRGIFANSVEGGLQIRIMPGMFVRVRIPVYVEKHAFLVSDRAIGADQSGSYVLVVNSRESVEQRPVKVGTLVDKMRVVREGLKGDEWIVVDGIQRARPGIKVKPVTRENTKAAPAPECSTESSKQAAQPNKP